MASSRTGSSQWKKVRKRALHLAQAQGISNCPYCARPLDYETSRTPASAEPDHIVAYAKGGQDRLENLLVCCRKCNQSKGNRPAPKAATVLKAKPLKTSRVW